MTPRRSNWLRMLHVEIFSASAFRWNHLSDHEVYATRAMSIGPDTRWRKAGVGLWLSVDVTQRELPLRLRA